jgi:hypothetical protein
LVARPAEVSPAAARLDCLVAAVVAHRVVAVAEDRGSLASQEDLVVVVCPVVVVVVVHLLLHPLVAVAVCPAWSLRGRLWMISCCNTCLPGTASRLSFKCR